MSASVWSPPKQLVNCIKTGNPKGRSDEITDSYGGAVDGDAIPAESQPAGFQAIPAWDIQGSSCENVNMAATMKTRLEIYDDPDDDAVWVHSFFLSAPFMVVHKLYDNMKAKTEGVQQ